MRKQEEVITYELNQVLIKKSRKGEWEVISAGHHMEMEEDELHRRFTEDDIASMKDFYIRKPINDQYAHMYHICAQRRSPK